MEKDRLKFSKKDFNYFFIPFIVLALVFGAMMYITARSRIEEIYRMTEESTISIADSYSRTLEDNAAAYETIMGMLDQSILAASNAVLLMQNYESNEEIGDLAEKFQVDQINLYNDKGVIVYSNYEEYIGWTAYEGHPVYDFMTGNRASLVEDIRQDTESKLYFKFGYVKKNDGTFVQVGIIAEDVHDLTEKFDIQRLVNDIVRMDNVENVYFTDTDFIVAASSDSEIIGTKIRDEELRTHYLKSDADSENRLIDGKRVLHSCAPVFHGSEKFGTLSIVWKSDLFYDDIKNIIIQGFVEFFLILTVVGIILYYAYRKNKMNVRTAYYDRLTGLPNKEYLQEYLEDIIKNQKKSKKAVLLLNCANFKTLNMTYGFVYGDEILRQISRRVKEMTDPEHMFFRFNADRFVLAVEGYRDSKELADIAEKLVEIFKDPFEGIAKHEYIGLEISIYEIENQDISADEVLRDASLALSNIEHIKDEKIVFYKKYMEENLKREDIIEKALRKIISGEGEDIFYLEFQPKLDIKNEIINGFEALARMKLPDTGMISPVEFIATAERKLLIYDLGRLILKKSCEFLNRLDEIGFDNISIAVNISAMQLLRDDFVDDVRKTVDSVGADLNLLEFEITESVLIENFELINQKLEDVKNMGITVSLDDFGTGFSSFARLRDLNIDIVKIDKQFIDNISVKKESNLISEDIISMVHKVGLEVVAEGVETDIQMQYLKKHDCDIIQGYLVSRPLAEDRAIEFLESKSGDGGIYEQKQREAIN